MWNHNWAAGHFYFRAIPFSIVLSCNHIMLFLNRKKTQRVKNQPALSLVKSWQPHPAMCWTMIVLCCWLQESADKNQVVRLATHFEHSEPVTTIRPLAISPASASFKGLCKQRLFTTNKPENPTDSCQLCILQSIRNPNLNCAIVAMVPLGYSTTSCQGPEGFFFLQIPKYHTVAAL